MKVDDAGAKHVLAADYGVGDECLTTALQPIDAPTEETFARILDHIGCDDLLLFSTDYPHWQFDGDAVIPDGLGDYLARKIMVENPQRTYPRLEEAVQ